MKEGVEEALDVLRQAMRNEIEGRTLYLEAIERTEDRLGQRMFRSLATDEEEHQQILQAEYVKLEEEGKWLEAEAAQEVELGPDLAIFPLEEEMVKKIIPPGATDLEALKLAMEFERRGYRLYESATAGNPDPTAQAVFRFLVQEESRHYALLDNAYDYLAHKGIWYFDDLEKPFFEG